MYTIGFDSIHCYDGNYENNKKIKEFDYCHTPTWEFQLLAMLEILQFCKLDNTVVL